MSKVQLAKAVIDKTGVSRHAATDAVEAVLEEIIKRVTAGEKVVISGFGTFEPSQRAARTARNPRTGEPVEVAAATVPKFKAGAAFKAAVNGGGQE